VKHEPVRSPLTHPLWLFALAVLLLNDHVLKPEPALAGALTGKLSDFAGLIVAPPLVATLLGPRRPWVRTLSCVLVGAAFVAIKVSPPCARGLEQILFAIGVPSRIWVDPTDLVALPSLWLAQRILEHEEPASRWLVRASLTSGLLASVATSYSYDHGGAALLNRRHFPLTAFVAEGPFMDCDSFRLAEADLLTRAHFQAARRVELAPMTYELLGSEACGVAWLRIEGEFDGVIAWSDLESRVQSDEPINSAMIDASVTVEGSEHALRVTVGDELEALPPPIGVADVDARPAEH
jgi:hypothetical protein